MCYFCERSDRKCEGWAQKFEFVRKRGGSKQTKSFHPSSDDPSDTRLLQGSCKSRLSTLRTTTSRPKDPKSIDQLLLPLPSSPTSQLHVRLCKALELSHGSGFDLLYAGEYFSGLPARIGHDECLDAAVKCIWTIHQSLQGSAYVKEADQSYGRALSLLRQRLELSDTPADAMTFCSALVLLASEACITGLYC